MPYRNTPLVNGQIYHIYNRGVEKRSIFKDEGDYNRFLKTLQYYQLEGPKPKLSVYLKRDLQNLIGLNNTIEIITYCLMPNHFHLLVRQLMDSGISNFVSKAINSYTKYFNVKYDRVGSLFQGQFKAVLVDNDNQLVHVHRYIHLNPLVAHLISDLRLYKHSSYLEYLDEQSGICAKEEILNYFKSPDSYNQFTLDQVDYAQQLHSLKQQLIDIEP